MKIDQTILASDPKRPGNCVSACVATFLDVDLERVPHFLEHGSKLHGDADDDVGWWSMLVGFMAGYGYWPLDLATVPHPSRAGLLDVQEVLVWRKRGHDHTPTSPDLGSPESAAVT